MLGTLINLLARSRSAGIKFSTRPDGSLRIQAPTDAAAVARAIRARQDEVLPLLGALSATDPVLDWRAARVADEPSPCVLCHRPALLRDPYDRQPLHKVCAERLLAEAANARAAA